MKSCWLLAASSLLLAAGCGDSKAPATDANVAVALFCGDGIFSADEDCDKAIVPGHMGGCGLVGDLDYNGAVDAEDVAIVTTNVGTAGIGDIDGDGTIDSTDVEAVNALLGGDERSLCGNTGRPFYDECTLECFGHIRDEVPGPVRHFTCSPGSVTGLEPIIQAEESPAFAAIRPTTDACQYDLVWVDGNTETTLSSAPGGYLLGAASKAGDAVCVSNIIHSSAPGAPVMEGAEGREMSQVTVQCAFLIAGTWSPLANVVVPDGDWAAWALGVEADPDNLGQFKIYFAHDFTWQFATLDDRNRPADDGIYQITYQADAAQIAELSRIKFRDSMVAAEDDHTDGIDPDDIVGPSSEN